MHKLFNLLFFLYLRVNTHSFIFHYKTDLSLFYVIRGYARLHTKYMMYIYKYICLCLYFYLVKV